MTARLRDGTHCLRSENDKLLSSRESVVCCLLDGHYCAICALIFGVTDMSANRCSCTSASVTLLSSVLTLGVAGPTPVATLGPVSPDQTPATQPTREGLGLTRVDDGPTKPALSASIREATPPEDDAGADSWGDWLKLAPPNGPQPGLAVEGPELVAVAPGAIATIQSAIRNSGDGELHLRLTALPGATLEGPRARRVAPRSRETLTIKKTIDATWRGTRQTPLLVAESNEWRRLPTPLFGLVDVQVEFTADITEPYGPATNDPNWEAWLAPLPRGASQPKLVCPQSAVNVGPTWLGVPPIAVYEFRNEGEAPLRLRFRWTCATYNGPPWALTLEPGARTRVEAPVISGDTLGRVLSNDPDRSELQLRAYQRRLVPIEAEQDIVLRFPGPQTRTVAIRRGDGGPIRPRLVAVREPPRRGRQEEGVKAEFTLHEIDPGELYELAATFHPPWAPPAFEFDVALATGIVEAPLTFVSFRHSLMPRLMCRSSGAAVPLVRNAKQRWIAVLEWQDGPPGRIIEVVPPTGAIEAHVDGWGRRFELLVDVPPEYDLSPGGTCIVILRTDDPSCPEFEVSVPFVSREEAAPK